MMSVLHDIRAKVALEEFIFSQHAVDQSIVRRMSVGEGREAIAAGEIAVTFIIEVTTCKMNL
jgi:hypothetical protein